MNELILKQLNQIPEKPGCYQMFNGDNVIIYIGKAKNLKKRVSQYFTKPHEGKTAAMVSHVDHFEYIVTQSEKEAFVLEMNLIQKYYPRYNILLKDDKHYPYIAIHNVKDPFISIARNTKDKRCSYFGPFPLSSYAYELIDVLNAIYPLRKCKKVPDEPCLYYHMGQCLGPCINDVNKSDYDKVINEIKSTLKGDNKDLLNKIKLKIKEASDNLDFENALNYKKSYDSIKNINEKQTVELIKKIDIDVIGYYVREGYISISLLILRNGILIGKRNFTYQLIGDLEEFIIDVLYQYYEVNIKPDYIVINNDIISNEIEEIFEIKCQKITRGKIDELITTAVSNAKEDLDKYFLHKELEEDSEELIQKLGNLLGISTPFRIELFDNSHLQGSDAIGAMVCFINGEPMPRLYRKFNITSNNTKDDLLSMNEVLTRRYTRLLENNDNMPDLIIVDGGENQLNEAKKVKEKLGLKINLCGLKKNDNHRTEILIKEDMSEVDISKEQDLFFFLTRMQDEVHRFAISSHKQKRMKSMYKSVFDEVKGLGSKRIEKLLKIYPTLDELNRANVEELSQFMPKDVAKQLFDKLHNN